MRLSVDSDGAPRRRQRTLLGAVGAEEILRRLDQRATRHGKGGVTGQELRERAVPHPLHPFAAAAPTPVTAIRDVPLVPPSIERKNALLAIPELMWTPPLSSVPR